MRFIVDECAGPRVAHWLQSEGHEVFSAYEMARGVDDEHLLAKAVSEGWIIITNDTDFGEMIFREGRDHRGLIFLRLADERAANKIAVLRQVLDRYSDKIEDNFLTVTETKVRIS